jgi:succinate dehydrogenase / fumarate reductase cytochrome b subunit
VKTKQPVYLNLFQFKFPVTAIASILHRISGVILFLALPLLLYALDHSLRSEQTFAQMQQHLTHPIAKLILWGVLSALFYHLIAGFRHLLMDMHLFDGKESGRVMAWAVIAISVIFAIFLGVCIW